MKISNSNAIQNNIYSLNTSRTTFYEYQYKPLMKFISSAKRRILICDEVGLGKTIETGIIMNELEARQELHNVLVVVPSNLQQKWYREMSSHFGMDFNIIRSKEYQGIISGDSKYARRYKHNRFIVSIESIRTGASLDVIEESEFHWDLLVLDEAHSIRNTSKQHNAIKALSINCDAIVFLTATPIHTETENLFNILSILDSQQFQQFNSFENQLRQNEPLVRALNYISRVPPDMDKVKEELGKVSPVFEDNYFYKAALKEIQALKKNKLSSQANSMDKLVNVQRNLSELHFLANSYTRTRKRDVMIDRPTRNANTVMVPFSPDEMDVYSSLVQAMKDSIRNKRSVDIFRLFNLQRMLSSSLAAFCGSAKGIELMEDLLDPLEESEEILSSEDSIDSLPFRDSKLLKLLELMDIIKQKSKKVIIFAFYVDTLNYLEQMLKKHGYKVFIMHGRLAINRET
jgi:SNF2 family DNA or RNA helicase